MRAIGLKIASVAAMVVMASMLKAVEEAPTGQLIFFRSFFAIFPVALYLAWRGTLAEGLRTANPLGHVRRGLFGAAAMALAFYALMRLPLPEAIAINYAMPLFIVILSAVLLGEVVRVYRWSAVLVGLFGVLVIMWPRLTLIGEGVTSEETLGALAAFAAALCGAFAMIQVRRLVRTETTSSIVVYFSLTCTVVGLATLPFGWMWPTAQQAALLVGAGIMGGIGQVLLTSSYRYAEMSIVAPFEYTSMLLSILIGFAVFGDVPTAQMLVGGLIVVGSGVFVVLRERRLGLERAEAERAPPPPA